jgi:hypothetical protein
MTFSTFHPVSIISWFCQEWELLSGIDGIVSIFPREFNWGATMKQSLITPMLKAYSRSLLGFIRFIRDRYSFPMAEKSSNPFSQVGRKKRDQG